MRRLGLVVSLAAVWLPALTAPASADHHFTRIREVFAGATGQPNAQFVRLQMFVSGQRFVGDKHIEVYDAANTLVDTFTFAADLPAPSPAQTSILIATSQAASFFGVTPDLVMDTAAINPAGGKVCFVRDEAGFPRTLWDCMAWGSYSGSSTGVGTPFNAAGGIPVGQSALRDVSGGANPAVLEAADDTNDSAADFDANTYPTPITYFGGTTTTAGFAGKSGGVLEYDAVASAVRNEVSLPVAVGGLYTLRDLKAPVTAGVGCTQQNINHVQCPTAGTTSSDLTLGPDNDKATVSTTIPTTITAGTGNDVITGGNGADTLNGGDGTDQLLGRLGDDTLFAGLGIDTLNGGLGADDLNGEGGTDTATWAGRSDALTVDIDAQVGDDGGAADGPAGARDTVRSTTENLTGGTGADTLIGNIQQNKLTGGLGADILRGLGSGDSLIGNDGVADTELSCDGGISPGTADRVTVDALDPAPTGCETIIGP